jgi:hypothetical protein
MVAQRKYTKISRCVVVYIRYNDRNEPNRTSMERNSNQISEPFCPSCETLLTELCKVIDGIPEMYLHYSTRLDNGKTRFKRQIVQKLKS